MIFYAESYTTFMHLFRPSPCSPFIWPRFLLFGQQPVYIYRPFLLAKLIRDIQSKYDNLKVLLDKDIEEKFERLKKWESGDKVTRAGSTESEIKESIIAAEEWKTHEQKVNEKFIRLQERFIGNPKKLSETILSYRRYLEVELQDQTRAASITQSFLADAITYDEWISSANETRIIREECERRLDLLLDS